MQQSINASLHTLINSAIETCDQLIDILQQEKSIIISGDIERLETQHQQKTALLEKLTAYDNQLRGKEELLRKADRQLGIKWELLRQKLISCKQHSAINGSIVNHCLKNTADALTLLRGNTSAGGSTYANDGKPDNGLGSRAIAKI